MKKIPTSAKAHSSTTPATFVPLVPSLGRRVAAPTTGVGHHCVGHYRWLPNNRSPAPRARPSRDGNLRRALTTLHLGDDGRWIGPPVGCWLDRYEPRGPANEVLSLR